MMWDHGMSWHALVWLGMAMFWLLVIVLALAPTKYLLAQANLADVCDSEDGDAVADSVQPPDANAGAAARGRRAAT